MLLSRVTKNESQKALIINILHFTSALTSRQIKMSSRHLPLKFIFIKLGNIFIKCDDIHLFHRHRIRCSDLGYYLLTGTIGLPLTEFPLFQTIVTFDSEISFKILIQRTNSQLGRHSYGFSKRGERRFRLNSTGSWTRALATRIEERFLFVI